MLVRKWTYIILGIMIVGGGITAGCMAVKEPVPVEVRAQNYWNVRAALTRDTDRTRSLEDDSLYREYVAAESRRTLSESRYFRQMKLRIWNPEVLNVDMGPEGNSAVVTIRFDTKMQGLDVKGIQIKEDWILENGKWMVLVKNAPNPFRRELL